MTAERHQIPGGVRANLRRTPAQRLRQRWATRSLGACGDEAFVEKGAEFLRHPEAIRLGANTIVKSGARICPTNPAAAVEIGDWTTVGYHTHIFATSTITIGSNCLIAPFCYLVDANHGIRRDQLIRTQMMEVAPITIAEDVWLGAGVFVLAGVTINTGAVVAAGSVVSRDIPEYVIAAGNPAVPVSERKGPHDAV